MSCEVSCQGCRYGRPWWSEMNDTVGFCIKHRCHVAPLQTCEDAEPARIVMLSSAARMGGSGDWFYDYAKAKGLEIKEGDRQWPLKWEHPGWDRAFADAEGPKATTDEEKSRV